MKLKSLNESYKLQKMKTDLIFRFFLLPYSHQDGLMKD